MTFSSLQVKPRLKKQKSDMARRGWNILRLALLWVRKGGVLKNKIIMDLRLVPKYFKNLGHANDQRGALHCGDRELSFDDTPVIHLKMRRPASLRFKMPNLPCIKPSVDFDYDFDYFRDQNSEEMYYDDDVASKSFLKGAHDDDDDDDDDDDEDEQSCEFYEEVNEPSGDDDDDEIDVKAEKFIAQFYEQMKLQRQISCLEYNEMLNRGVN